MEQNMRRRKRKTRECVLGIATIMTCVSFCGCAQNVSATQETTQTIVTKKDDLVSTAQSEEREKKQGSISEQVQAPERYQAELSQDNVKVTVDAPLIIPDEDGFHKWKVTARTFMQEDYDIVSQVILKNAPLWNRDYDAMDNAPDSPVTIDVPAVVPTGEEKAWLNGYATVDGEDFFVSMDNTFGEKWHWVCFGIENTKLKSSYLPTGRDDATKVNISEQEVRKQAQDLMTQMKMTDFVISGEEYMQTWVMDEVTDETARADSTGYCIHFTRELDGIPVTYTDRSGNAVHTQAPAWPYEQINMTFDEQGLTSFAWVGPYDVELLSEEYEFLLPFSEIQDTFEKMVLEKYGEYAESGVDREDILVINEIRLGYMRVIEKEGDTTGTMIPVWDFMGTHTISQSGGKLMTRPTGQYASLITINALDGTIIDRDFGY